MTISRGLAYGAAVCWSFVLVGATVITLGDHGGINAVVGAGVPALVFTVGSVLEHQRARRRL